MTNNYYTEQEKIENYIHDMPDDKETKAVESLFSGGENNELLRDYLEKDWYSIMQTPGEAVPGMDRLLDHIHHEIRRREYYRGQSLISRFARSYMKVAAVLLLPLLAAALIYLFTATPGTAEPVSSKIYAPMGSRVSFTLPDGTTGMLNSGSTLAYNIPFTDRNVILEGEGWFEVTHDKKHPFEIQTGDASLMVLGTAFNISAYPSEQYIEVVLKEGRVKFTCNGCETTSVLPGERMVYQEGAISKTNVDPEKYIAWTEGKLVFRGDSMTEVARRLERWYNVKVIIADKELEHYSFRATFEDDSLEEVLKFLSMTSPIVYEVSPRKTLADGTYEKTCITLFMK